MPTFIVGADLQANKLQTVLPEYKPAELGIYAAYLPNRQLAAKVPRLHRRAGRTFRASGRGGIWWSRAANSTAGYDLPISVLTPFQTIWMPMQNRMKAESRIRTLVPWGPSRRTMKSE